MSLLAIIFVWCLYHFTKLSFLMARYPVTQRVMTPLETIVARVFPSAELQCMILLLIPIIVGSVLVNVLQHLGAQIGLLLADMLVLIYIWSYQSPVIVIPQQLRQQTRYHFSQILQQVFPAAFWLVVLGPVAALFYDFTRRLLSTRYAVQAHRLLEIFDWLPARLLGVGYALAGHFPPAFAYWRRHVFNKPQENFAFLEACGLAALNGDSEASPTDIREPQQARALVKRAQRMLLGALAIFMLGRGVY